MISKVGNAKSKRLKPSSFQIYESFGGLRQMLLFAELLAALCTGISVESFS